MSLTTNEVVVRQLEDQLENCEKEKKQVIAQLKKQRKCMQALAEKICDSEYGESQLNGKNMVSTLDDMELRDFIIKNVLRQRINFTKAIRDLQKIYLQEKEEKNKIAMQLLNEQKEKEEYKKAYETLVKEASENSSGISLPLTPKSSIIPTISESVESADKNMVYYDKLPYDISEIYNALDVYQLSILKIIGESGYNETNDIIDTCATHTELGSNTLIRDNLKLMVANKILETESISTPIRRKLILYSITSIGAAIYKKEYGKLPIKDEKTRIKEMHATLQHGYCIKDTVKILEDLGYTEISMDSTKNAIEVANNRRYVPDIIANFDAKTKTYWEVELGHHKDGDFYEKLEKAAKVTSLVYIVVNDAQSWEKVKKQITGFRLKLKQEHRSMKLTVLLGTMMQLSKKDIFFNNPENKFVLG